MTVGIMCSCLPVTGAFFHKLSLRFSSGFAKIRSTLSFRNTFHRLKRKQRTIDILLETGILGSAFGDGKFLKTEDAPWKTLSSRVREVPKDMSLSRRSESSHEPVVIRSPLTAYLKKPSGRKLDTV